MLVEQLIVSENKSLKEANPSLDPSLIIAKIICTSESEINAENLEISKNENMQVKIKFSSKINFQN
jgi:hypothetical protein